MAKQKPILLDYDGCLPGFADLAHGKVHEIKVAREMKLPADIILVFDMGYYDYTLYKMFVKHEALY